MTDSCNIAVPLPRRNIKKVMLGDSNTVINASLAATKRLRSSTVADLPCQVCGKLSKSSVVTRGPHPSGSAVPSEMGSYSGLEILTRNSGAPVPRSGVVVCEACKKFCSRFATRLSSTAAAAGGSKTGAESEEWMTKCGCRKLARTEDGQTSEFDQSSLIDRTLADMCRWCRFRRCHALGLVVDNEAKAALKGPIDLHSVPCAVCAAPSSGYHFGVISCEGCKGFFRRTIHHQLEATYVCESNGLEPCDVTTQGGRRCKKCRFSKCIALGMSLAAIRTGRHSYQLRAETRAHLAHLQSTSGGEFSAPPSVAAAATPTTMFIPIVKHQPKVVQFVTPSSSETSRDQSPIPIEMPLDVPSDLYDDDNKYNVANEGAVNIDVVGGGGSGGLSDDDDSSNSDYIYNESAPKRMRHSDRDQHHQHHQVSSFLTGGPSVGPSDSITVHHHHHHHHNSSSSSNNNNNNNNNDINNSVGVMSPAFPEADSPTDSDIFQPLSGADDSPSLGSSGNGSPRAETVQDAIARMRRPCEKSPYVWLYDSAREYVDLRQPNPRPACGNSLSTVDKDPLRILDDYFFVTPILPDNIISSHLPMPDVTRAQWIIRRVVQSSRLIGNITSLRTVVRPEMTPVEVFISMVGHFDTFSRFVLQFVKSLPGFDSVCLPDRTRLFIESMFPLLSAQLSLDYDEVSQTPNICGLEPGPGRQLAFNYFYHLGLVEPSMKDAGISMKQARLCVIEFSMICGLLYFNPDVPGLAEPNRVRRIFDEYQRAAEIFIGRNFAMNGSSSAASRIQLFYSQLSYFRSFYRFFSWILCDFGHHYPTLVSMDPWLSELHGRISQMNEDKYSPSSAMPRPGVVSPASIAAAAAAAAGIPSPTGSSPTGSTSFLVGKSSSSSSNNNSNHNQQALSPLTSLFG